MILFYALQRWPTIVKAKQNSKRLNQIAYFNAKSKHSRQKQNQVECCYFEGLTLSYVEDKLVVTHIINIDYYESVSSATRYC